MRPAKGTAVVTSPIEAWLTPIVVAAVTSGVVSSLGYPIIIISYYRYRWGTYANTPTGRLTLLSGFGVRTFLFCAAYSVLFGLCYREWPRLRTGWAAVFYYFFFAHPPHSP